MAKVKTNPVSLSLTQEEIKALSLVELKDLARDSGVKSWQKLKVDDLRIALTSLVTGPVTEPATELVTRPVTEPATEPAAELVTGPVTEPATELVTGPVTKSSQNSYRYISLEEFTEILKDNLLDLTEVELTQLQNSWSITDARCKTPGVTVVKRSALIKFLNNRIRRLVSTDEFCDYELTESVFNQVVSMASNSLPRQVMTIKGASRFKYLLPHTSVSVIIWTLENLHRISEAIERAEVAQNQGYASPRDSRESRGLKKKVSRQ
jgi:hypothetical protein